MSRLRRTQTTIHMITMSTWTHSGIQRKRSMAAGKRLTSTMRVPLRIAAPIGYSKSRLVGVTEPIAASTAETTAIRTRTKADPESGAATSTWSVAAPKDRARIVAVRRLPSSLTRAAYARRRGLTEAIASKSRSAANSGMSWWMATMAMRQSVSWRGVTPRDRHRR